VLTWIVATVAATGLAWAGVRSVVDGVAAPLPAPAITAGPSQVAQQRPADDRPTASTNSPTTPATSRPEASPPARGEATVRTFRLVGGEATVRFSPTRVEVLGAAPAPGFSADVDPDGDATRVEFESADHRSRLDVWWDDRPRHEIDEHAQRGGDDDDGDDDRGGDDGGDDD
jgi:hypothetical protein